MKVCFSSLTVKGIVSVRLQKVYLTAVLKGLPVVEKEMVEKVYLLLKMKWLLILNHSLKKVYLLLKMERITL